MTVTKERYLQGKQATQVSTIDQYNIFVLFIGRFNRSLVVVVVLDGRRLSNNHLVLRSWWFRWSGWRITRTFLFCNLFQFDYKIIWFGGRILHQTVWGWGRLVGGRISFEVNLYVILQLVWSSERFSTIVTLEWPLTSVAACVSL